MEYEQKPRLALFMNKNEGSPIQKKDGSFVVGTNGKNIMYGAFNGKIILPEGLPAGNYEVSVYRSISKAGLEYFAGNIKKAFVKQGGIDTHSESKGNGYAPQANHVEEESSDEIPF